MPIDASFPPIPVGAAHDAAEQGAHNGRLAENIIYFARALREAGIIVGPGGVADALDAVIAAGVGEREDLYWTLHANLIKQHEDSPLFEQAFRVFFRRRFSLDRLTAARPQAQGLPRLQPGAARIDRALSSGRRRQPKQEDHETEFDRRFAISDLEVLQRKDFTQMSADEIALAKAAIRRMVLPLDEVATRRLVPARRGHAFDMRRTLRASMSAGGSWIDLKYRGRARRPPPLVALLDISGSMGEYTRLFLHFLHAVTDARKRVQTFLFGTRLTNVTRALRAKDTDEALATCSAWVADWSGGTRIATSLHTFNKEWNRRVLAGGAVVLLITDGLERDGDDRLAFEMDRLHRSCRRLIWLNPLLRFAGFEAKARGIKAMLPHVDEFRPVHNLASIAELCRALSGDASARRNGGNRPDAATAWLRRRG